MSFCLLRVNSAKDLALCNFVAMRDSSSPSTPQNDSSDAFFRSLQSPALPWIFHIFPRPFGGEGERKTVGQGVRTFRNTVGQVRMTRHGFDPLTRRSPISGLRRSHSDSHHWR